MGSLAETLTVLIHQYPAWAGIFLSLGAILQGEIALFFSMYLVVSGALPWRTFFLVTLGAIVIWEFILFFLGRIIRHTRSGWRWYRRTKPNPRIQFYSHYLRENLTKLFLASHFLVGMSLMALVLTGWSKTSFGKFLRSYFVGVLTWFFTMTLIAYASLSGLFRLRTANVFRHAEFGIILIVLLIFGGEFLFRRGLKKREAAREKAKAAGKVVEKAAATLVEKGFIAPPPFTADNVESPAVSKAEPLVVSKTEPPTPNGTKPKEKRGA